MYRPLTKEDIHVGLKFISKGDYLELTYTITKIHSIQDEMATCSISWVYNNRPDRLIYYEIHYKYFETDYEHIVDLDEDDDQCI